MNVKLAGRAHHSLMTCSTVASPVPSGGPIGCIPGSTVLDASLRLRRCIIGQDWIGGAPAGSHGCLPGAGIRPGW